MEEGKRSTDKLKEYKNILVIQTAFIGDAILASSLVEKLHHEFPVASISILVRKGNGSVYDNHPFLKEVLIWNKHEKKIRNLLRLLFEIRSKKFDCVINCHRYFSSGLLAGFSGARHIAGYKQNPLSFLFNYTVNHKIGDGRHEIERYNQLVADFAGAQLYKPRLYPSEKDYLSVAIYQQHAYFCMAPASGWFTKQLPQHKWVALCKQLPHETIYLLGAASDVPLCEEIARLSGRNDIQVLAGKLTLLQSCALMEKADMNFVNDSAPLHLASSVNAPVRAFFTSTVPAFGFGPLSDNSITIGLDKLPCRPCGVHGYNACPLGHFKCGNDMPLNID
jgi:heptosyltransferase-2